MPPAIQAACAVFVLLLIGLLVCHLRDRIRYYSAEPFETGYSPYDALRDQMEGPRRHAKQRMCHREVAAMCGPSFGRPGSGGMCFSHGMAQCMNDLAPRFDI